MRGQIQSDEGLEVVVGTSPSGPNVFPEIQLVKPALLYGDRVRLLSPAANLLGAFAAASQAEGADRAAIMVQMAQAMGDPISERVMLGIQGLLTIDSLPRSQRRRILGAKHAKETRDIRQQLDGAWQELQNKVNQLMEEGGAPELEVALESGLVEVEPLIEEDFEELEDLLEAFVSKLAMTLADSGTFPLFDDRTGSLVSAGVGEGLFTPSKDSIVHGKEVGAASQFMNYVPAFAEASIREILDIRTELRIPLVRFRQAMVRTARLIDAAQHESDFAGEASRIYREEVAPAIQEIKERIEENVYLKRLLGESIKDIPKWLGRGFVAFAMTPWTDVPALVVAGASALEPTAKAAWNKHQEGREIRKSQYYFLYETGHLLSR